MVVDDQDSDTHHETPSPRLLAERRATHRLSTHGTRKTTRHGYGARSPVSTCVFGTPGRGAAAARPPPRSNRYPRPGRRTLLSRPLNGTGPHRCCSSEYGRAPGAEGYLQN
ncbi:hypothetical protein GCM10010301_25970 [Streptomyces plicatus]|nr:hypothetical protein GCM10010301_25970 [Streptomyces plicatus]